MAALQKPLLWSQLYKQNKEYQNLNIIRSGPVIPCSEIQKPLTSDYLQNVRNRNQNFSISPRKILISRVEEVSPVHHKGARSIKTPSSASTNTIRQYFKKDAENNQRTCTPVRAFIQIKNKVDPQNGSGQTITRWTPRASSNTTPKLESHGYRGVLNGRARAVLEAHKIHTARKQYVSEFNLLSETNGHRWEKLEGKDEVNKDFSRGNEGVVSSMRWIDGVGSHSSSPYTWSSLTSSNCSRGDKNNDKLNIDPEISPKIDVDSKVAKQQPMKAMPIYVDGQESGHVGQTGLSSPETPSRPASRLSPRTTIVDKIFEEHLTSMMTESKKRRRNHLLNNSHLAAFQNSPLPSKYRIKNGIVSSVHLQDSRSMSRLSGSYNSRPDSKNQGPNRADIRSQESSRSERWKQGQNRYEQVQSRPDSRCQVLSGSDNRSQGQSRPDSRSQGQSRPDSRSQVLRGSDNRNQGQSRPDNRSQVISGSDNRSQGQSRPDSRSQGQSRPDSRSQGQSRPDSRSQGQRRPDSRSQGQRRPDSRSQGQRRPDSRSQGQRRPDGRSQVLSRPDSRSQVQSRPDSRSQIQSRPDSQSRVQSISNSKNQGQDYRIDSRPDSRFSKLQAGPNMKWNILKQQIKGLGYELSDNIERGDVNNDSSKIENIGVPRKRSGSLAWLKLKENLDKSAFDSHIIGAYRPASQPALSDEHMGRKASLSWKVIRAFRGSSRERNIRAVSRATVSSSSLKDKTQPYKKCALFELFGDENEETESDLEPEPEKPPWSATWSRPGEPPLEVFRRAVRLVRLLLHAAASSRRETSFTEAKNLSFAQYQDELLKASKTVYGNGLSFDPLQFKAQKEITVTQEVKEVLQMEPEDRTEEQLHTVLVSLQRSIDSFGEFPIRMQKSLIKTGTYEYFEAKRVIIRQGHLADNFYFILTGTAIVTILEQDNKTGEEYVRTAAQLGRGNSFGELALMHGARRSATVSCQDDMELLAVGRQDFIDIFMHVEKDKEPEHIYFLRTVDMLKGWPIDKLPWNNPKICLLTYFRRGTIMCKDSNKSEWVYIIKSGSCRVLKVLKDARPNKNGLVHQKYVNVEYGDKRISTFPSLSRVTRGGQPKEENNGLKSGSGADSTFLQLHTMMTPRPMPKNDKYTGLITIAKERTPEIELEEKQHQRKLEQIFKQRHPSADVKKQRRRLHFQSQTVQKEDSVVVKIKKLGPREMFGLEPVVFSMQIDNTTDFTLVSDGSEAVLISKKFFQQHLEDDYKKMLRTTIQPYPSEDTLQTKFQDQTNWNAYKTMTLNDQVLFSKYVHDTLSISTHKK